MSYIRSLLNSNALIHIYNNHNMPGMGSWKIYLVLCLPAYMISDPPIVMDSAFQEQLKKCGKLSVLRKDIGNDWETKQ